MFDTYNQPRDLKFLHIILLFFNSLFIVKISGAELLNSK